MNVAMIPTRCRILLLFLAVWTSPLFAGEGSIYSRYGVGDIVTFTSTRTVGMGGTGIAMITDGYVNGTNPAALGILSRVQYSADYQYQGYKMNDGTGSNFLTTGTVQSALLALPVYTPYGVTIGVGLLPFSQTAYDVKENDTEAGQNITQIFDGVGGLSSAQVSLSVSPETDLYLGGTFHYIFGNADYRQRLEYPDAGYFTTDEDRIVSLEGFGGTVGAAFTGFGKLFGLSKEKKLALGATFFTGTKMDAKEELIENFVTSAETTSVAYGNAKIPMSIALGLMFQANEKLLFACDARFQSWNDYTYFGVHPSEIRNSSRYGIGLEYAPRATLGESFFRQVQYRAGAYTEATYLMLDGEQIKDYFVTGGVGLPLYFGQDSEGRLNLGLEYGVRGTTSNGLELDHIIRFTISVSGSDTWFTPTEIN